MTGQAPTIGSPQLTRTPSGNLGSVHVPISHRLSINDSSRVSGETTLDTNGDGSPQSTYSDHFYRHNEALRKRALLNHGGATPTMPQTIGRSESWDSLSNKVTEPFTEEAGHAQDLNHPTEVPRHLGPYGWHDPLDVIQVPLERFLSKPQCLPYITIVVGVLTFAVSAVFYFFVTEARVEEVALPPNTHYTHTCAQHTHQP